MHSHMPFVLLFTATRSTRRVVFLGKAGDERSPNLGQRDILDFCSCFVYPPINVIQQGCVFVWESALSADTQSNVQLRAYLFQY